MQKQYTNQLLMIRPVAFGYNPIAAETNTFQQQISGLTGEQIQDIVTLEFDNFVALLRAKGIQVEVFQDTPTPHTPDSIFPNNWMMTTPEKQLYTFPMAVKNRREERSELILNVLKKQYAANDSLVDFEKKDLYLEGTGSLVLDRVNKIAYAALSSRTSMPVLEAFGQLTGYEICAFETIPVDGQFIYHTNILMGIADQFAVVATDLIHEKDRKHVLDTLENSNKIIISLTNAQTLEDFAGNALQVANTEGDRFWVLSKRAFQGMTEVQKAIIQGAGSSFLYAPIHLIETLGGGSARCMLAELF